MDLSLLIQAVTKGKRAEAIEQTKAAVAAGASIQKIVDALVAAMDDVGRRFQCGEAYVPEMLMAARVMKECMVQLEPQMIAAGIKPAFTAVIGTVQGDLHDIGKNLVAMMWRGACIEVIDLGINVSADRFVAAIRQHNPRVVGLSALLTTTMTAMKTTVEAIRAAVGSGTCIIVGGAPINEQFALEIGANGYAPDAAKAVEAVRKLVNF